MDEKLKMASLNLSPNGDVQSTPSATTTCYTQLKRYSRQLSRKKSISIDCLETNLRRCLTTFDITLIGVGVMIGAGIFVLTGREARQTSGPAIVIAYAVSGFVSLLAALCYAEFGAKVPKAGSSYTYTYVTIGEFWAFLIGWNVVLEYVIASAAVVSSLSSYIWALAQTSEVDSCASTLLSNLSNQNTTITSLTSLTELSKAAVEPEFSAINSEMNWLALVLVLSFCAILAFGVRGSTNINSFCTIVNVGVIILVLGYGFTLIDGRNWTDVRGGFFPYGYQGVLKSSATCFFAYFGFDVMATTAEEAKNPGKSVPLAIILAMGIVTTAYCLMASVLTLMVPYYEIDPMAAFARVFESRCAHWAKYTVSVGAVTGMTTTMLGDMFILPRTLYALAQDGLIFKQLAYVHPKTQAPLLAIFVSCVIVGLMAMVVNVEALIDMLAVGTMNAYSWVSACVLVLRYAPGFDQYGVPDNGGRLKAYWHGKLGLGSTLGRLNAGSAVQLSIVAYVIALFALGIVVKYLDSVSTNWVLYIIIAFLVLIVVAAVTVICMHEENTFPLKFKVKPVPLLPLMSVAFNVVLVCSLEPLSWARFLGWTAVGLVIYFSYGYWHSEERKPTVSPFAPVVVKF